MLKLSIIFFFFFHLKLIFSFDLISLVFKFESKNERMCNKVLHSFGHFLLFDCDHWKKMLNSTVIKNFIVWSFSPNNFFNPFTYLTCVQNFSHFFFLLLNITFYQLNFYFEFRFLSKLKHSVKFNILLGFYLFPFSFKFTEAKAFKIRDWDYGSRQNSW